MDKILGTIDNKQDEHGYMKIIRTIAPVGIGAFCIERFFNEQLGTTDFVVVYDCGKGRGAITSNPLKRIIDSELGTYEKSVDFLFLSHFDNDHINGLSYLIATGLVNNADTTVFLPLIQAPHIYLYEHINNLRIFDTVGILQQHGIKIVFVKPDAQFGDNEVANGWEVNPETEYSNGSAIISSYTTLLPSFLTNAMWRYVPFYLQDNGIYKEFLSYVKSNNPYGVTEQDFPNFLDWTDEMKNWLKKRYYYFRYSKGLYDPAVSPINMNAMLLISDKTENAQLQGVNFKSSHLHDASMALPNKIGCSALYTSDVGLNSTLYFDRVRSAIHNYIDGQMAGLFQIPHHASIHCYNANTFLQMPFEMAFCNCKQNSKNPAYCSQYELDAKNSHKPYAIVDDNLAHRLEMEIQVV